jgi:hypothetical protein
MNALPSCNLSRTVGTIVRHHENLQQFLRIVLPLDTVNEVSDNDLLIVGGDNTGVSMPPTGVRPRFFPEENTCDHMEQLITVNHGQGNYQDHAYQVHESKKSYTEFH